MINLIPANARKEVVKEYWVRVVTVWFFVLSVFAIIVALSLLPVYVLVTSQVSSYSSYVTEVSEKVAEYDLSAKSLLIANNQAQMIISLRQASSFSGMIASLESLKGEGVSLDSFEFKRNGSEIGVIQIEGKALLRQDLIDFRDALINHQDIKDVELPISNLAKDKDVSFSIAIILNPNKI